LTSDQSISFERDDHLVDRRRGDAEVALHVCFGRRAVEHVRVSVDEGQILTLLVGEALPSGVRGVIFDSSVDSSGLRQGRLR
jgi:hypothetical protein